MHSVCRATENFLPILLKGISPSPRPHLKRFLRKQGCKTKNLKTKPFEGKIIRNCEWVRIDHIRKRFFRCFKKNLKQNSAERSEWKCEMKTGMGIIYSRYSLEFKRSICIRKQIIFLIYMNVFLTPTFKSVVNKLHVYLVIFYNSLDNSVFLNLMFFRRNNSLLIIILKL